MDQIMPRTPKLSPLSLSILSLLDHQPARRRSRPKKKRKRSRVKTGSTRHFWCIYCEKKTLFVRRKIVGQYSRWLGSSVLVFNDGSSQYLFEGMTYTGDECIECKKFIVR